MTTVVPTRRSTDLSEPNDVIGAVLARDAGLYQRNVDRVLGHHREVIGRAMRRLDLQINAAAREDLLVLLGHAPEVAAVRTARHRQVQRRSRPEERPGATGRKTAGEGKGGEGPET